MKTIDETEGGMEKFTRVHANMLVEEGGMLTRTTGL
jgi:hypothetical protein